MTIVLAPFTTTLGLIQAVAKERQMTRLGTILLLITVAALVVVALARFPGHLTDVHWPPHAKAHLIGQISTTVALAIASLAVLAGPFLSGRK
jgi:hypothetical protein